MEYLEARMTVTNVNSSGSVLEENQALVLEMVEYQPMTGSSYLELPPDVFNSKAVLNIENEDQQCFKWSALAALHPQAKSPQRVSKYKQFENELNFEGIEFPAPIHQISKFEKNNPGMSVTVIGIDKPQSDKGKPGKKKKPTTLMPLHVPEQELEKHITLLYWRDGDRSHYALVKNLNRLFSGIKSQHGQTYFCPCCFQGCTIPSLLQIHKESCKNFPIQVTTMVDQDMKFTNWAKTEYTLFRLYGDFECNLKKIDTTDEGGKTVKVNKQIPCSCAWVLYSDHPDVPNRSFLYRAEPEPNLSDEELGDKVVDQLMISLQELEQELKPFLAEIKPTDLTEEQEAEFQAATHCYMCDEVIDPSILWRSKVRDHNQATGEYRGAAHQSCNLNKRRSTHIPVFFDNLRGYDSHLIMQGIHRHSGKANGETKSKNIRVIANNMERYVPFQET